MKLIEMLSLEKGLQPSTGFLFGLSGCSVSHLPGSGGVKMLKDRMSTSIVPKVTMQQVTDTKG